LEKGSQSQEREMNSTYIEEGKEEIPGLHRVK
jgi:hypothetical protein